VRLAEPTTPDEVLPTSNVTFEGKHRRPQGDGQMCQAGCGREQKCAPSTSTQGERLREIFLALAEERFRGFVRMLLTDRKSARHVLEELGRRT